MRICLLFSQLIFCCILTLRETELKCLPTEVSVISKTWYQTKTICRKSCPANQYIFKGMCHKDCPSFTSKTDNGFIKYCNNIAINDLECPKFMCTQKYPYCFNGNCLSSCPEYTVGFNHSCVMKCPNEATFMTAYSCRGVCYTGEKSCSRSCPESHPHVFHSPKITHCLNECPDFTAINKNFCNLSCPVDFPILFNRSCLGKCPATHSFISLRISPFNKIFMCTERCPEEMASHRNVCVSMCPNGTYLDNGAQKRCLEKCDDIRPFIYTTPALKNAIYYRQCLSNCPSGNYALLEKKLCVSECPKNYFIFNGSCLPKCPYSHPLKNSIEGNNRYVCVKYCPQNEFKYEKMCIRSCPSHLVHYLSNCSSKCFDTYPFLLRHNRTCVSECPSEYLYNGKICDNKCPENVSYIENRTCTARCANTSKLYKVSNIGNECINLDTCPNETMLLKGSRKCIKMCPKETHVVIDNICTNISECLNSYVLQATKQGNLCTEKCPLNLFRNGRNCISRCPDNKVIIERNCKDECTAVNHNKFKNESLGRTVCFSVCPDGFVNYMNECINNRTCIYDKGFYIFNKTCHEKCPKTTIITTDAFHLCKAVDIAQAYNSVAEFFAYAGFSSVFFYFVCCYKGCCKGLYRHKAEACDEHSVTDTQNLIEDTDTNATVHHNEQSEEENIVL